MITLKQLKSKLEKDFGWENLESDDNKWFVENLLKDTIQAIEVIRCCKSTIDNITDIRKSTDLFSAWIDLYNSLKDQDQGEGVYLGDDMYLQPNGEII